MPEMVWSSERRAGRARTMLWRIASEKTMKAGLPVLAASVLRHSRRRPSRSFWAEVKADLSGSMEDLRVRLPEDFALRDLDFEDGVLESVSLSRRRMGRSSPSSRLRPSWVREAFL